SIVADDDALTLKITLESPNADFPAIASFTLFSPIDKGDYEKIGNTTGWGTKGITVGNGPFMLESADSPDTGSVVLVRTDKWNGNVLGDKKAPLDKLTFMITQDVASSSQAFESGEGDSATIAPGQYASARQKYPNTVDSATLGSYFWDIGHDFPPLAGEE